jgi:hypothetical protein
MKKLIIFLLFISNLFAYKVYTNFQSAVNEASKQTKPILLIAYSPTCPHCANYFATMRQNADIMQFIRKNYIACILNVTKTNIPANIPFDGTIPFTEILYFNGNPITPPLKGEIPMNYLGYYLANGLYLFMKILEYNIKAYYE